MSNFGFPSGTKYAQSQVSSDPMDQYTVVENGGLFSKDECKNLARKIIEAYDGNGDGVCETIEVAKWLVDCYRAMNRSFQPTPTDISTYVQVVDRQRTGKISRADLEDFLLRFFHNPQRG